MPFTRFRHAIAGLAAAPFLIFAPAVQADEFTDTLDAFCNHAKECALAEMEGSEDMTEALKAMVMQSLEGVCQGMKAEYGAALRHHELHDPAIACMRSMTASDCSVIMEGENETPECIAYEAAAEAYEG